MVRVAVTGGTGAMGAELRREATTRDDIELGLVSTRADPAAISESVPVVSPSDLASGLDDNEIDVVVDFTVPAATLTTVERAIESDCAVVSGTTGFDENDHDRLTQAAEVIPLMVAPNFSRGIHALVSGMQAAIEPLPGYDIEITETHHNRKRDAPSGTADRLVSVIEAMRADTRRVHGREGEDPRESGDIGIHARRAGEITGEHEVLVAGNAEELRLVHRAESRRVFAAGALDAATWIAGKPPGSYQFAEVLES